MGGFSPGWVKSQTVMISKDPPPVKGMQPPLPLTLIRKKDIDLLHPSIPNRDNIKENG